MEVILSGGEPLLLPTERLAEILVELSMIKSVDSVRVASRLLATLPQRISIEVCQALRRHPACWLMAHFNHPRELTVESRWACALLADHGIALMSQTVLLRGVNDDASTLEALFRGLVSARVRPYYLLQADPVCGTGHLRTPIDTGIRLMSQLQGRLSGIALPKLIVDTPGGKGKVPIGPDYLVKRAPPSTTLRTFRGELVDYLDPVVGGHGAVPPIGPLMAPAALKPGDLIAVVAPSGTFDPAVFGRGIARLKERYEVRVRPDIHEQAGYLAGSDDRRLEELSDALKDKSVKAIVAARGGYGSTRLLEHIDIELVAENKKLLVGFSDLTALHALWARAGIRSLHGSMVSGLGACEENAWQRWITAVEGEPPARLTDLAGWAPGTARGPLAGGNLSILTALLATPFEPPLEGRVLFLEDTGEPLYRIDRMLTTLLQSGRLNRVVGVMVGSFDKIGVIPDGVSLASVFTERLSRLKIPVLGGIPAGHIGDTLELPLGAEVTVDTESGTVEFHQPVAEKTI